MCFNVLKFLVFIPFVLLVGCGDSPFDVGKRVWGDLKSKSGSFHEDGYFEGTVTVSSDDRVYIEIEEKQNWADHRWAKKIEKGRISLLKSEVMEWEKGSSAWDVKQQLIDVMRPLLSSLKSELHERLSYFEAVTDPLIIDLAEKSEIKEAIEFIRIINDSMDFIRRAAQDRESLILLRSAVSSDGFSLESVVEFLEANTRLLSEIPGIYQSSRKSLERVGKTNYATVRSSLAKVLARNFKISKQVVGRIPPKAVRNIKGFANRAAGEVLLAADSVILRGFAVRIALSHPGINFKDDEFITLSTAIISGLKPMRKAIGSQNRFHFG